ncbi:NAD(P)H-hydrate dehydratase [Leifsonia sp. C5G2]|uniref:NAD(P)H-hydrate dehydratase n=1 Tax=Leifsonia sp. C5G2 TaxID=2735269 RepID=UPI001585AC11|nr:NAD(P)H-hydrate dehydratase [Leifsonia sp. C5G2]NUU05848.1 NAD(P)H-hydrate dehydratase [Leifsonia sp. C5G2]
MREARRATPETVTPELLRAWPLPQPSGSKRSRGEVVVVGGALRSPGAALLAGRAALRVGAGRLTLAVGSSVAVAVAVALPESGVVPLPESSAGSVRGAGIRSASSDLAAADAVLIGPGLDDAEETARMLTRAARAAGRDTVLVLDAYALGALAGHPRLAGSGPRILTPNTEEAGRLLGREVRDLDADSRELARRYRATVSCFGRVAAPDGRLYTVGDGGPGLGTSGSGDALAGAIAGLAARGADPVQAAVWGTYLHAAAGESLAREAGPLGFLASEIVDRLTAELTALS